MKFVAHAVRLLWFITAHPANRRRPLRGLARAVTFQVRARRGHRTLTTVGRQARMWVDLHYAAATMALYANPPNWNEMTAWRRVLRPGDLFIDVGSNVGTYALWVADCGASVIAVEPDGDAAGKLRENVALNDFPIVVHQCALADRPGRMRMTVGKDATNHLLPDQDPTGAQASAETTVETLDGILGDRYAAGVKIDVEGAERLVLEGARAALSARRIGVLQIEWNDLSVRTFGEPRSAIVDLLQEYGYRLARPDRAGVLHPVPVPPPGCADVFAIAPGQEL